jgi:thiol-disulfide isomerase/thioredoxin
MMPRAGWRLAIALASLIGIIGLIAALTDRTWSRRPSAPASISSGSLLSTELADTGGNVRSLAQWAGRPILLNFWATWCAPCVEEIPALSKFQSKERKNLQIVGIAVDSRDNVLDFQKRLQIDYPILLAEKEGLEISRRLGNRLGVLPFSVLVDGKGEVIVSLSGPLTSSNFEQISSIVMQN